MLVGPFKTVKTETPKLLSHPTEIYKSLIQGCSWAFLSFFFSVQLTFHVSWECETPNTMTSFLVDFVFFPFISMFSNGVMVNGCHFPPPEVLGGVCVCICILCLVGGLVWNGGI